MKRHKHSLSNYKLLSCNMGTLIPIGLTEVLPGDSFQHNTNVFMRVAPMLAPVMHPVDVRIHHWFVPHRIIWQDWEKFITGGPDGMNASVFPTIGLTDPVQGQLPDYLGIAPGTGTFGVSALPFRAYAKIFNECYRDQDLTSELPISYASGNDITTPAAQVQSCSWEKDYFTTARPWASKGPDITIPSEGTSNVTRDNNAAGWIAYGGGGNTLAANGTISTVGGTGSLSNGIVPSISLDPNGGLSVDMVNDASINSLREAFALQRYQEARARYGSRYTEYLRYLGIKSSDARLQRPEYLGGGKQKLQFSEVLQTSQQYDSNDDPIGAAVGELRGHGIAAARSNRYRRFFEEHGYVMTIMSVRPKTIYVQGLPRTFNRRTKEDFWQKELQFIGQQAILNKEIKRNHASPDGTFGYQDRYDEYRRQESTVAGEFRDQLDYWHMARVFASDPTLNAGFVGCNPTNRIYASGISDQLYVMANHSIQARRLVAPSGGHSYVY